MQQEIQPQKKRRRFPILQILLAIGVVWVAVFFYHMISNSRELQAFCASVDPGTSRDQVQAMVATKHYQLRFYKDDKNDTAFIRIPGDDPPNNCVVAFTGDRVASAKYVAF